MLRIIGILSKSKARWSKASVSHGFFAHQEVARCYALRNAKKPPSIAERRKKKNNYYIKEALLRHMFHVIQIPRYLRISSGT